MRKLSVFLVVFFGCLQVFATPKQTMRMIYLHNYNISNSFGAIANNYNIRETWFVDSKSVCRQLGVAKGAIDAVASTLRADNEFAKLAAFTRFTAKLAALDVLVDQTTSYCGRSYAGEGNFNSKLEGNNEFLIAQMKSIADTHEQYSEEMKKVEACVQALGSCE